MNLTEIVRFALRGLSANKLRSGLTTLGILIGVGAVILLVAVGTGSSEQIKKSIQRLGRPGGVPSGRPSGAPSGRPSMSAAQREAFQACASLAPQGGPAGQGGGPPGGAPGNGGNTSG